MQKRAILTRGFILIEMLVATAIASVISAALFAAYSQLNRTRAALENSMNYHKRLVLLKEQLSQDIAGACLPTIREVSDKKNDNKEKADQEKGSTNDGTSEKEKKIPYIFYGINASRGSEQTDGRGGHESHSRALLTFLTNNPLQTYWDGKVGKPKPRLVRVVYTLAPENEEGLTTPRSLLGQQYANRAADTRKRSSYALVRHEFEDLSLSKEKLDSLAQKPAAGLAKPGAKQQPEKGYTSFVLIRNIKNLSLAYGVTVYPKKEEKKPDKDSASQQKKGEAKKDSDKKDGTFEVRQTWDMEKAEKTTTSVAPIPERVTCTVTLWSPIYDQEKTYSFVISIIPDFELIKKEATEGSKDNNKNAPEKASR
jgi:type II secretory pathway pseudopilin PulG